MKANEYKSRMLSSLVMQGLDVDGLVGGTGGRWVHGWVGGEHSGGEVQFAGGWGSGE